MQIPVCVRGEYSKCFRKERMLSMYDEQSSINFDKVLYFTYKQLQNV